MKVANQELPKLIPFFIEANKREARLGAMVWLLPSEGHGFEYENSLSHCGVKLRMSTVPDSMVKPHLLFCSFIEADNKREKPYTL